MFKNEYSYSGGSTLSDVDITNAINDGEIFIAPYNESQLQPSGYNLTPTRFFYSTKKKKLLKVVEDDEEAYVMIDKNDTVLVRTRESIIVSRNMSGAFYSKVKVVSLGFGHVSTTLDPQWEGQLLISLNNPTNKRLKFSIEKNVYGKKVYNSFVTLEFVYLKTPTKCKSDNKSGRLDILDETIEKNNSALKKKEVEKLRILVNKLHSYEEHTIEKMIAECLNESEKRALEDMQTIKDEDEFQHQYRDFMNQKKHKYLRILRKKIDEEALESIDIVNDYIRKKQQYLPWDERVLNWFTRNRYILVMMLTCLVACSFLIVWDIFFSNNNDQNLKNVPYQLVITLVVSIVLPTLREVFKWFYYRWK